MLRRVARAYRAAFAGLPRAVWIQAIAALVNRSGTMVLPFLSLYLTRQLGFEPARAGQILAFYGVGSVVASYAGGALSDRRGPVRVQIWSLVGAGFGFLFLAQARSPLAVVVAVFFASLLADSFRPAVMTGIATASGEETRTRSFALLRLAVNLGMAIGPAVGGYLAAHNYSWLFVGDALTGWAAAVVLWRSLGRLERREDLAKSRRGGRSPWRDGPFLAFLGLMFVLACAFFQVFSTLPLYLRDHYGLVEQNIGTLLALNAVIIVVFEMVLLRTLERFTPLRVAAFGVLLIGLGLALMPLGSGTLFAAGTVVVWTVGEMLALPLTNAAVAHRADAASRGRYMGAYAVSFSFAFVVAPAVGTAVYQLAGPVVLWSCIGLVGAVLSAGFWRLAPAFVSAGGRSGIDASC